MALSCSKTKQKSNFNDFFLIFAPETALKLILPAGRRIQFFFREVSYDVLSSESMFMCRVQAGPGWYKWFSLKIAKKWLKFSKIKKKIITPWKIIAQPPDFYWKLIFKQPIFRKKKDAPKDGVKLLKNEQKGNFNDFFLIFAPKTALKLLLPAGRRIKFFFSGKSVMMSYHQKLCSWAKARGAWLI